MYNKSVFRQGLAARSPHLCRRVTFVVRTAFVVVLLFDIFFAGSVVFKLFTSGIRGTGDWIAEIGGPRRYWGVAETVAFQALATFALWRLQLKVSSRAVTAHVVHRTAGEVDKILAKAVNCNHEKLVRDLTAALAANLIDGEPRMIEFPMRRSKIKKSGNTEMAWETAMTTVRVFAKGPVPKELIQSLRELDSSLRG